MTRPEPVFLRSHFSFSVPPVCYQHNRKPETAERACHFQTDLDSSAVNLSVGAQGIADINGLSALELPITGCEGKRLGGQCPNRAQVNDIARQLAGHELLNIGADL